MNRNRYRVLVTMAALAVATAVAYSAGATRPAAATGVAAAPSPIAVVAHLATPQPPPGPAGRIGAAFAPTPGGARAVLYGGGEVFDGGAALGDTWVWDGTSWTSPCGTPVACPPGERELVAGATAPGGVVLYGGVTKSGSTRTLHGDTWLWNGHSWSSVCGTCPPGPRAGAAMAGNGEIVLLFGGGSVGNTKVVHGDTWQLKNGTWTRVDAGGSGNPAPRIGGSMVFDGRHFVLFGGLDQASGRANASPFADTWIWSGGKWVRACGTPLAACGPRARLFAGLAPVTSPDPQARGALLVGGMAFPNGTNGTPVLLGDIWFWNGTRWAHQSSPWPDSTLAGGASPPTGLPFVGALTALPAFCQTVLAADFTTGPDGAPVIHSGTWSLGFDANRDHRPDTCAASVPAVTTTTPSSPTSASTTSVPAALIAPTDPSPVSTAPGSARLPATGANGARGLSLAVGVLAAGAALVTASARATRRRARRSPR